LDVIYAVKHPELETCYRAKLTSIGTYDTVAHFIDYGDSASVPLSDIRTCPESVRDTPPMAIKRGLKLDVPDDLHWTPGSVRVLKAVAEEEESLEAVFCEEVDGMKLIRSLKTDKLNLVEVIEEAIQNSASKRQEAEVDPLSDAVEQQI
jgi:Tudor domain